MEKSLKEKVQEWIDNGCDFDKGLQLLSRNSNHRSLIKHLGRGEANDDKKEHLLYNLTQLAGVDQSDPFSKNLPEPITIREDEKDIELSVKKEYPDEVIELKKHKAKLYNDRAKKHKKFHDIGTANDAESCSKRKSVKDAIEAITNEFNETDAKIQSIFDALRGDAKPDESKENASQDGNKAKEAVALQRELTNNVAYISKNKSSKKQKIIDNVEQRKARNEEIRNLLTVIN